MKLPESYNIFWFFRLIILFVLIVLPMQVSRGESADVDQLKSKRAQKAPSMASPSERWKMEGGGGMVGIDRLTDKQGKHLLTIARKSIEHELFDRIEPEGSEADLQAVFREMRGTFVTLTIDENLRGCIGHIIPQESLIEGVRVNAINAAFKDPRFRPLTPGEWEKVKIEISILTDPKPLAYSDADDLIKQLHPDSDGVIIKKGFYQATFLPQVWEQLPKKEDFLAHLCLKAGLDSDAWKKADLDVSTYQVQAFEE